MQREKLRAYAWPGNVRELVNLCRRLTVLAPGNEIRAEDLPPEIIGAVSSAPAEQDWIYGAGHMGRPTRVIATAAAAR